MGSGTLSYWGVVHAPNSWTNEIYDLYWDIEVQPTTILVTGITLNFSSMSLNVDDTQQLIATISPNNATNKSVRWLSSNTDVASVNSSGLVTAKSNGTVSITCAATDGSGVKATCEVTVGEKIPITDITLDRTTASLSIAKATKSNYLYATVYPHNASNKKLTWTSSDTSVASVSGYDTPESDGTYSAYLNPKSLGTTTITCSACDGSGVYVSCTVNVYQHGAGEYFEAKTIEGVDVGYWVLDTESGTCEVAFVNENTASTITIPGEVEGFSVVSINQSAFTLSKNLTKVNLPSSVEEIKHSAFYGTPLASIALDNVKRIGRYAFSGCKSLSKITGITQLEYIGEYAFRDTPWYEKLPDGLIYLGKVLYKYKGDIPRDTEINVNEGTVCISPWAFSDAGSHLIAISIPHSVTDISYETFTNCFDLKKIVVAADNTTFDSRDNCNAIVETNTKTLIVGGTGTIIPESITAIGEDAFYGRSPSSVVIPDGVDSIANYAFLNNSRLKSVAVGSGLRTLGEKVFGGCNNIDSITVSDNSPYFDSRGSCNAIIKKDENKLVVGIRNSYIPLTVNAIGSYAFCAADRLESLRIHDGVEIIENNAFSSLPELREVTIGSGVKEIGKEAFANCRKLTGVHTLIKTPFAIDESVFKNVNATLYVPRGTMINYMTTEGWANFERIVEVDDDALVDGELFTEETVEGINLMYRVTDCQSKTCELVKSPTDISGKVTIPDQPQGYTVTGIGQGVFYGHKAGLTEIVIPEHVKTIGSQAFREFGLTSLVIPCSVDSIGTYAFAYNSFNTVVSKIENPKDIDNSVFYLNGSMFTEATLYVPLGTKAKYEAAEGWKKFKNIIEGVPDGIKSVIMHENSANSAEIFTPSGQRLTAPRRGVNIIGGRKVVVK